MDFGILPPEIISALIHSGPGAWSLIEAAGFWQELSAELEQSASSYTAELSWLSTTWHGPSSMAMAQALEPYLAWLRLTAQQCQQTAASVQVVAAAFEWTHWTVVHPSLVAANRARLAMLLATNFFGVNYPAIAETEAEYHTMWVNNSAAMYRYAATSAGAVKLPQFSPPPEVANPSGATTQAAMVHAATTGNSGAQLLAADSIGQGSSAADAFDPNEGWFGYWSTWGISSSRAGCPSTSWVCGPNWPPPTRLRRWARTSVRGWRTAPRRWPRRRRGSSARSAPRGRHWRPGRRWVWEFRWAT